MNQRNRDAQYLREQNRKLVEKTMEGNDMNRRERRRMVRVAPPLPPARADKRPLYFDINSVDHVQCYHCIRTQITMTYTRHEAFMADPANAPDGSQDILTICKHHLPENAVIYDPTTNLCRDKTGQNTWMEDAPDPDASFTS